MIRTSFSQWPGIMSDESIGGLNVWVLMRQSKRFSSGTCSNSRSKLKLSKAPVSWFFTMPMVPPV